MAIVSALSRNLIGLLFACGLAAGCQRSADNLSLDQPRARDACQTFLTAWKEGRNIEDLKPKIVGRDADWEAGAKLESFEILPNERPEGPNLILTVRRSVQPKTGGTVQQDVEYVVGTSPVVTVFRNDAT